MAVLALLGQTLVFNAVDFTDHSKGCQLTAEAAQLDSTAMGDTWVEYTGGLKSGTATMTLMDDFASGSIDATVWAAFSASPMVPVALQTKPTASAISTTNPEYQVNILPTQWNVGGTLGELAGKQLTFPLTGAITRDTTP